MPKNYDVALVNSYAYMHAHFGELLDIFSQPIDCTIIRLLKADETLSVSEIKKKAPESIKNYVLSRHLSYLASKGMIEKEGKLYRLNNDIFYDGLVTAAKKTHDHYKNHTKKFDDFFTASVTSVFSSLIYDRITNILIHMLLGGPKSLNEIVEIYRSNHEYVSSNVLRYHLNRKKFSVKNHDLNIFQLKNKHYSLTKDGKFLHKTVDIFFMEYCRKNEEWMRDIWSKPIRELVSTRISMAQPGDKFYKVLRMLGKTDFVIIRDNTVRGIVTIEHAMSAIGDNIQKDGFWGGLTAEQVMIPISEKELIPGSSTLKKLHKKKGAFSNIHYVVQLDADTYSVLDLNRISKIMNTT